MRLRFPPERLWIAGVLFALGGSLAAANPDGVVRVGPMAGGGFLLPDGWRIRPAGKNIPVSTLPMSQALSPDGRYLAVLNGGYAPTTVSVIDLKTESEVSRTPLHRGWRGLAFSPHGDQLYVGNGPESSVTEFSFRGGRLSDPRKILVFTHETPPSPHLTGDVQLAGRRLLVADCADDCVAVIDCRNGRLERKIPTPPSPYGLLVAPDGDSVFVSSWSGACVGQFRLGDGAEVARVPVGRHPTGMAWLPPAGDPDGAPQRLAVACADTNDVYVLNRTGGLWTVSEKIDVALFPRQPVGMTPSALAYREGRLYVACSDANAVAVVDVASSPAKVLGFIPTGWYPTAVRALPDGRIAVVNGKGLRSFPNSHGLTPYLWPGSKKGLQHVALLQKGSVSLVAPPDAQRLAEYSRIVRGDTPYRDRLLDAADVPPGNPIPRRVGGPTPIRNVILVTMEMCTYDQVLGDLPRGDGDLADVQFGERITPNQHRLARDFVLLDNFYCAGDVSKDGYFWISAGIAPDTTQRTWPMETSQALPDDARYDAGPEGFRTAPDGQIWDRAQAAGESFYNYGWATVNRTDHPPLGSPQVVDVLDPVLKPHTSYLFPGHDPRRGNYDYSILDVDRVALFKRDLMGWEGAGKMPRLILMNLAGDHTVGLSPGRRTPDSCMADNDLALGELVEAVSRSRFWPQTAIFVEWDDSQDGNDHVDCHRSPAFVVSPYAKRHAVDHTFYNNLSMLRTIELILGLRPMTVFDAGAAPMAGAFRNEPDFTPYTHAPARVSLELKNPPGRMPAVHTGAE